MEAIPTVKVVAVTAPWCHKSQDDTEAKRESLVGLDFKLNNCCDSPAILATVLQLGKDLGPLIFIEYEDLFCRLDITAST